MPRKTSTLLGNARMWVSSSGSILQLPVMHSGKKLPKLRTIFPMIKIFLRPLPVRSSFRKSEGTSSEATGEVLTLGDGDPSLDPSTAPDAITILKHLV